jgi:hypothetical protein
MRQSREARARQGRVPIRGLRQQGEFRKATPVMQRLTKGLAGPRRHWAISRVTCRREQSVIRRKERTPKPRSALRKRP